MRKTDLTVHKEVFISEQDAVRHCIDETKRQCYVDKIDSSSSPRQLFAISDELFGKRKSPQDLTPGEIAPVFASRIATMLCDRESGIP